MCYAVLVVKYKNSVEPNATLTIVDESDLDTRIAEFQARNTIESIEVHKLAYRLRLVEQWAVEGLQEKTT
jgi:hypothetical protein